jgi:hypothetical protein
MIFQPLCTNHTSSNETSTDSRWQGLLLHLQSLTTLTGMVRRHGEHVAALSQAQATFVPLRVAILATGKPDTMPMHKADYN